jgi:hypothetical protein
MATPRHPSNIVADWFAFCGLISLGVDEEKAAKLAGVTPEQIAKILRSPPPSRPALMQAIVEAESPEVANDKTRRFVSEMVTYDMRREYEASIQEQSTNKRQKEAVLRAVLLTAAVSGDTDVARYLLETSAGVHDIRTLRGRVLECRARMQVASNREWIQLERLLRELEAAYTEEKKTRGEIEGDDARAVLSGAATDAAKALANGLKSSDAATRRASALAILNRTGYPETQRVEGVGVVQPDPYRGMSTEELVKEAERLRGEAGG